MNITQDYTITHFSTKKYFDDSIYLNLVFKPLEETFYNYCIQESEDYNLVSFVKKDSFQEYKKSLSNIKICDDCTIDFSSLNKYMDKGYFFQNNILCRLKPPFNNVFRFCEVFENNSIVKACLNRLEFLSKDTFEDKYQSEFSSILKTLEQWWY